ncbi:finger 729-like isoform X1 [Octopus vulgaris]|uniref:Finger 729-like isoform X1 n=1 Tax=Octopus vulgaris TaxID=6645 RepID=A0AA36AVU3_OCTVU|nr:finger 729-like isoform X1 [Octopus vulgaris]
MVASTNGTKASDREKIGRTSLSFKCNRCDEKFRTFISLMKHRNVPSKYNDRKCGDILPKICLSASMVDFLKHNRNIKLFQCKTCQKDFSHITYFLVHLRIHSKQAPYICDYCSKTFIIGLNLQRHLESHKTDVLHLPKCESCSNDIDKLMKLFKVDSYSNCCRCPFCYKNIKADKNFTVAHLRSHFPEHSTCAKCNFRIIHYKKIMRKLKTKVLLQSPHRSLKRIGRTGSSVIECERCGEWFKRNQLAIHLISHSMEQLHCMYCDVIFRSRYLLKKHEATCENKDVIAKSEGMSMKSDLLKERNNLKQCPFCSQIFLSFTTLKMHLPTHAENYALKPDFESLEEDPDETNLETSSERIRALSCINGETKTNGSSVRNLKPNAFNHCSFCSAICQNVPERKLHEMDHYEIPASYSEFYSNEYKIQHHSNLLYQCKYCRKVFMSACNFNSHIDCHFSKPPFYCKVGREVFTSPDGYFDHEKDHSILQTRDNSHAVSSSSIRLCEICGEIFHNLNIFKKHLKSHEMKCINCSTPFSTDKSLHDHMKHLVPITGDNDRSRPAPPRENIDVELTLANAKNNRFPKAETYTFSGPDKRNLSVSSQGYETGLDFVPFYKNRPNLVPSSPYQFEPPKVSSFCERRLLQTGKNTNYYNPLLLQKNKSDSNFSVAGSNGFSRFNDGNEAYRPKPTRVNINCNFSSREEIGLPHKSVNSPVNENLGMDNFNAFKSMNTVAAFEPLKIEPTNSRYQNHYSCSRNKLESSNIFDNKQECGLILDIPFDKYPNALDFRDENQLNNQKENENNSVLIQAGSSSTGMSHFKENNCLVIDTNDSSLEQSICENWESKQKGKDSDKFQLKEHTALVSASPLQKHPSKRYQPADIYFSKSSTIKEELGCLSKSKSKNIYSEYNFPKYSISLENKSLYATSQSNNCQDKESTFQNRRNFLKIPEVHSNWNNNGNISEKLMIIKMSKTPIKKGDAGCHASVNENHFSDANNNTLCDNLTDYTHTTLATSCDHEENFSFI